MHSQEFQELMKSGIGHLFESLSQDMPLISPLIQTWARDLAGSLEPADYFLHPVAFPLMLLPWWLERQLQGTYDPTFQVDLIDSNASLYYYVRLIDNVMDGHATVEPKLLPTAGYFVNRFHNIYHSYFQLGHPFWNFFDHTWSVFCDVTAADGQLNNVNKETFTSLVARKVSAAKISVAAVCYRYEQANLIPAWEEWIDTFGCWHLFREDLFDWQQDLKLENATYLLSEAGRRKRDGEAEASWIAREGLEWAMEQLTVWMNLLNQMDFVSPEISAYLQLREKEVIERREVLRPAYEFIRQISESTSHE